MDEAQEKRLLQKLKRLTKAGSSTSVFVAEELERLYQKEMAGVDLDSTDPEKRSRLLIIIKRIGDVNSMVGKDTEAMGYYDQVLRKGPATLAAAQVHLTLGHKDRFAANWSRALGHFKKAITIFREKGDPIGLGDGLRGLGYVNWRKGDYTKALELYGSAIEALEKALDESVKKEEAEEGLAIMHIETGNVNSERGYFDTGLESFSKAKEILTKFRNHAELSRVMSNIGHNYLNMDRLDDARREFEASIKAGIKAKDDRILAWGYFNLAEVLGRQGLAEKALALHNQGLKHLKLIDDKVAAAKSHYSMAFIHMARKENDRAILNFEESIRMVQELGTPHITAYYSMHYGVALIQMGDDKRARTYLSSARKTFRAIGADGWEGKVKELMGSIP